MSIIHCNHHQPLSPSIMIITNHPWSPMNCWLVYPQPPTSNDHQPRSTQVTASQLSPPGHDVNQGRSARGAGWGRFSLGRSSQDAEQLSGAPLVGRLSWPNHPHIDAAQPGICLKNMLIASRSGRFPFIFRSLGETLVVMDTLKMGSFSRGGSCRVAALQTTPDVVVAYCIEMCFSPKLGK